jgi:hypothetical protein
MTTSKRVVISAWFKSFTCTRPKEFFCVVSIFTVYVERSMDPIAHNSKHHHLQPLRHPPSLTPPLHLSCTTSPFPQLCPLTASGGAHQKTHNFFETLQAQEDNPYLYATTHGAVMKTCTTTRSKPSSLLTTQIEPPLPLKIIVHRPSTSPRLRLLPISMATIPHKSLPIAMESSLLFLPTHHSQSRPLARGAREPRPLDGHAQGKFT